MNDVRLGMEYGQRTMFEDVRHIEYVLMADSRCLFGETRETMCPYILGTPSGNRSSLFVNQETGQSLKKIYNALIDTGMFGPIRV